MNRLGSAGSARRPRFLRLSTLTASVALARVMPDDAASTQHYRDVASRLSEYERGEAERALRR